MSSITQSLALLLMLALGTALLAACGQKGPLFLPDADPPAVESQGAAEAAEPAAGHSDDDDEQAAGRRGQRELR